MQIAEIFYSLQGEGQLTGVPSVFIRTSGCNLRCSWCDTKYASWQPEDETISVAPGQHCVLTGGEPTVAEGIVELAAGLRAQGRHVTIESNGTQMPNGIAVDLASLSPKLSNSVPDAAAFPREARMQDLSRRWNLDALRAWIDNYDYQLKFVVASDADVEEIQELLQRLDRTIPSAQVMLMPEGVEMDVIRGRGESLLELCKRFGYRYCRRLHIELFGNTRGT